MVHLAAFGELQHKGGTGPCFRLDQYPTVVRLYNTVAEEQAEPAARFPLGTLAAGLDVGPKQLIGVVTTHPLAIVPDRHTHGPLRIRQEELHCAAAPTEFDGIGHEVVEYHEIEVPIRIDLHPGWN